LSLLTHGTITTLAQLAAETLLHEVVQAVAQGFEANTIDNLTYESSHEELAGFTEADTALLHIEEGIFVELTHSGAMTALYVVGIDLELRLGVHTRLTCET
jgi:hypothetical protein